MLTSSEIKSFIDDDMCSEAKRHALVGQRYKEGLHDILKHRIFYFNSDGNLVEDKTRANVKIAHPFFSVLVEQLSSYMLSFDENPVKAKEKAQGLQKYLDEYFDDEFWAEIGETIEGAYTKGFEYIYGYVNELDRLTFECADSMGVVEVRAKDASDNMRHFIYWYIDRIEKGRKQIKRIQVWDSEQVYFYTQTDNGALVFDENEEINPRPHKVYVSSDGSKSGSALGYIPFWRLDNNKKKLSGLVTVKDIIDDYDMMMCGISNNLLDADFPIYFVKGFQGDDLDELSHNLKTKRLIGADSDGGIEVHTVNIPYEARKTKAQLDKENIFTLGFGFNPTQLGDGNITNVVILSRYTLLDLKAKKMLRRLQQLLKQLLKVILPEINERNGTEYGIEDIYFDFKFNIPANETENIQNAEVKAATKQIELNNILNIADIIGEEQTLKAVCEVMDWDYEKIKNELFQARNNTDINAVRQLLASIKPDDGTGDGEDVDSTSSTSDEENEEQ